MKFRNVATAVGIVLILGLAVEDTEAQDWRLWTVLAIGSFAIGMITGTKEAQAAKEQFTQVGVGNDKLGNVTATIYKLGPAWKSITTYDYCISFVKGICSGCNYDGKECRVQRIEMLDLNKHILL